MTNLNRKTKAIIAIVAIVILSLASGYLFANKYGYYMNVETPTTIIEETTIQETPQSQETTPEPVETPQSQETTETPQSTDKNENKSVGQNVGRVVDEGIKVLKNGAGWLGEKMANWGNN